MNISSQFLNYNASAICTCNQQTSVTITCGIQPTGVVTMTIKVSHNTCNMCICDLPDMYTSALRPVAFRLCHTYWANPSCPCYNHCIFVLASYVFLWQERMALVDCQSIINNQSINQSMLSLQWAINFS